MKQIFNLKSYVTFLSRNKVYTAINVFGLSVSLMFVILLTVYVQQEYTVDHQHTKLDRITVLGLSDTRFGQDGKPTIISNRGFGPELAKLLPEVEAACGFSYNPGVKVRTGEEDETRVNVLVVDSTFYHVLDFELLKGDPAHVLDAPNGAVINEQLARTLFGDRDPMGRRIQVCRVSGEFDSSDSRLTVVVTGVFRTMGNTTMQTPDLIFPFATYFAQGFDTDYKRSLGGASVLLLSKPGTTLIGQERKVREALKQIAPVFFEADENDKNSALKPVMIPLRGLYLDNSYHTFIQIRQSDAQQIRIFGLAALIILLFSVMNYVNLTVALSGYRAREMATRRLFGSQRLEIVLRLILESVVLCVLSLAIAVGLVLWLTPYMEKLLNTPIHTELLLLPQNIALILAVVLLIGILAGVAPATIQSRAKPIEVVRGTFRRTTRMLFSRVFIIIQNVITIALIAAAVTIWLQVRQLVNAPLGYDTHGIIQVGAPFNAQDMNSARRLRDALLKLPCVEQVSFCDGSPLTSMFAVSTTLSPDNRPFTCTLINADEAWLPLLGITVKIDRYVSGDFRYYPNQAYLQGTGMKETDRDIRDFPIEGDGPVGGIMEDFHIGNILNADYVNRAKLIKVYSSLDKMPWWVCCLVKVKGDEEEAYRQVNAVCHKVFKVNTDLEYPYLDQMLKSQFEDQNRLQHIVSVFAGIAMLISLLGLIAMSTYFIQQRRKEIAVRKVFGSTSKEIRRRLVGSFLVYVVVAFVLAAPIVWRYVGEWLAEFPVRVTVWPGLIAAGVISLVISFLAVAIQSYLASNENPIGHIKDNG